MDEQLEEVKFEGVKVRIGNREFVMPSLSVGQAKRLWPQILKLDKEGISAEDIPEKFELAVPIIHAALSRNYPQLTVEQVEDMVSISQLRQLLLVVSGQSGMKEKSGETQPAEERRVVH